MGKKRKQTEVTHPSFSAEWGDGDGLSGVYTSAEGLQWWYRPDGPGGRFGEVGVQQPDEDFLINGPEGNSVPAHILEELHSALRDHG